MKSHIKSLLDKGIRMDGRKFDEYRDVKIEYGITPSAEGSARVKIGDTEVVAGVKMAIEKPFSDTEDQGILVVNVELSPLASPNFELGPPSIQSIELSRVVDRAIRESHYIDVKKLCIKKGEEVWSVMVDVYPINDEGNLFDAASIAALAAIKDAKIRPVKDGKVDYKKAGTKGLPVKKEIPLECTLVKIGNNIIVDPNSEEEALTEARLTVGVIGDELCSLQKGGWKPFKDEEIKQMIELAVKKVSEIKKKFK